MDGSHYLWKYIHEGHEWFSDYSRGRQAIFMCLAFLLCEQFCLFVNGGAKIIDHFLPREIIFLSQKITSIRSNATLSRK